MRPIRLNAIVSLALIAGLAGPAQALEPAAPPDTTITKEMLADGIYLFRAPSDLDKWTATNVVVIVNDDDVTVFDSNSRLSTARAIIAEIKKITPKPVRTLINSHWHLDHWSGNDAYVKAYPGVQIIATTETRDYMKRMTGKFYAYGLNNSVTRARAALDSAIRTGKKSDGTRLTPDDRRKQETDIAETADGPAITSESARVSDGPQPTWAIAAGVIDVSALAPGRYVVRARVIRDREPLKVLTQPFVLTRSTPATAK